MKYFTPELYVRGQSDDDSVLNEVERLGDEAIEAYASSLRQARPCLPGGVTELLDRFDLHGAEVLSMGRREQEVVIVVQPGPAVATVMLSYELVESPHVDEAALPPKYRSERVAWMYDEVEWCGGEAACQQSILLSNGWEVCLRFRDLRVVALEPLLLSGSARRRLAEARRIQALHEVIAS